jgi:S-(hydroxymethyl)mycothiol dehydrogenase
VLQNVGAVIARFKDSPAELAEVVIQDPGPRDVVVAIEACGVCHTDLAYRDGDITDTYTHVTPQEIGCNPNRPDVQPANPLVAGSSPARPT